MKHFTILLFFFCNCLMAQQAANSSRKSGIKANFSMKVLEAYEENSFSKVGDFYQLLEIYSDVTASEALKNQVRENIHSLFKENSQALDFFTSDKIPLDKLLEKINLKGFKFQATNIKKETTFDNYWTNSYSLKIFDGKKIQSKIIKQRIYFYPEEKIFGSKKKEVWIVLLGEME